MGQDQRTHHDSPPRYLLVVDARIDPTVEDEWNHWYDEIHLPQITECPGFVRSARYVNDEEGMRRYLTIYELDDHDAVNTQAFSSRRGWDKFAEDVDATTRLYRRRTPPISEDQSDNSG